MIDFNKPMVVAEDCIYEGERVRFVGAVANGFVVCVGAKEAVALINTDGDGCVFGVGEISVRNAPTVERIRTVSETHVGKGQCVNYTYDLTITDGKVTAIELVK